MDVLGELLDSLNTCQYLDVNKILTTTNILKITKKREHEGMKTDDHESKILGENLSGN